MSDESPFTTNVETLATRFSTRRRASKFAAYEALRHKLIEGELQPGQFVTQSELAEIAGVKVAAAREAIQKLEHQSLLKVHPQRGIQIANITLELIRDAYGLRRMLEVSAMRHFARDAPENLLQDLKLETVEALNLIRNNSCEETLVHGVGVDWKLHDVMIANLNNEIIEESYHLNALRLRLITAKLRLTHDFVVYGLEDHQRMLECCLARDVQGAAKAMEDHVNTMMVRAINGA